MAVNEIRLLYIGRGRLIGERIRDCLRVHLPTRLAMAQSEAAISAYAEPQNSITSTIFLMMSNQKKVLPAIRKQPPDIFFIEMGNRPSSRIQFCEAVRKRFPAMLIIAVGGTKKSNQSTFDGFISLPIEPQQVINTVGDLLQRCAGQLLICGEIQLNLGKRLLTSPNGHYRMPPKQYELLKLLMQREEQIVTRGEIMQTIWNTAYLEDTRTLDVHIRWLRERIEVDPSMPAYLRTVRGIGYQFCGDGTDR